MRNTRNRLIVTLLVVATFVIPGVATPQLCVKCLPIDSPCQDRGNLERTIECGSYQYVPYCRLKRELRYWCNDAGVTYDYAYPIYEYPEWECTSGNHCSD